MKVYQAINAVQGALAKTGIAKDRVNTQGSGYNFRGIDDVYNAISPLMAEHGLCILPRMLARTCEERQSQKGNALFYVVVDAEFDFVSAEDGSKHTVKTYGEAMDSGDKATNKAMSAAYKYAAFQTFAIPTQADNDADAHTHVVEPEAVTKARQAAAAGLDAYKEFWGAATFQQKKIIGPQLHDQLKKLAEKNAAASDSGKGNPQADESPSGQSDAAAPTFASVMQALNDAKHVDLLDAAADLIRGVADKKQRDELTAEYKKMREVVA
jgi:hypothetical protein